MNANLFLCQEGTNARNDGFILIDKSFINEVTFDNISYQEVEEQTSDYAFRILKISHCPSLKCVLRKLEDDVIGAAFKENSHCFVVVIETQKTEKGFDDEDFESLKSIFDKERPLIIQTTSVDDESVIYYKDSNMSVYIKVSNQP